MHSLEAKQNSEHCNRRRRKNETCIGDRSRQIAEGKQTAFADTVAQRASGIRRRRVHQVMKRIKSHCDRRSAASAKLWSKYLDRAENQERGREIAQAVRENACEKMPIGFGHLPQAGRKTLSVMPVGTFRGRHEKRKRDGGGKSGNERPFQNAAHADESDQRRGAKRAENGAHGVHRALESECAALLLGRYCIREQCVARRPAAAAACPSKRAHDEDRRPALCESVSERRKASRQVSKDSRGFAPSWTICDPATGQFCKTREAVGYALDHAQRKRRSASACEKCRQDRGS